MTTGHVFTECDQWREGGFMAAVEMRRFIIS